MTPIQELGVIEELVLNRASPAEIRPHLLLLLPQIEALVQKEQAYATLEKANAELKEQFSKFETKARVQISNLQRQNSDLESQLRVVTLGF
ncbi:MAG: hypothetical protein ABSH38_06025 [Verrucomicrobiota bacterium]|jgi:ribosome-associated translation inhibitor RaiA